MDHHDGTGQAALLAAVIEHLACHLQTGRPRSAHLAMLLLERISAVEQTDPGLRERCLQLQEVLAERAGPGIRPGIRPATLPGQPWLTWHVTGEAA
ncbi:MAG: hypothetical protein AB1899_06080 [Pseudomonadota bacterium]